MQVGIPLLMFVAGTTSSFWDTTKDHSFKMYVFKRSIRLLFPLLYAIPIFLIPRLYLGQEYEPFTKIDENAQPEQNFVEFFVHSIPGVFKRLSWLWFLPGLFVVCILNYPFLVWSQRRSAKLAVEMWKPDGALIISQVLITVKLLAVVLIHGEDKKSLLAGVAVFTFTMVSLYFAQVVAAAYPERVIYVRLIGPMACVLLN